MNHYIQLKKLSAKECHYCGRDFKLYPYLKKTADHIVPRSKGGTDRLDNIVICCRDCNKEKGNKDYQTYVSKHPRKK